MYLGYGWRAKIAQLYPSGGQCDFEVQRMSPEGVQWLTTRLTFTKSGLEDDHALVDDIEVHAQLGADAGVQLMLLNCTAASAVVGPDVINGRVEAATGVPSTTTFEAVLEALRAAGLKRIALMTAYVDEVNAAEIEVLKAEGFEVVACGGIPCTNPLDQGAIPPERWYETAMSLKDVAADGLLISCAGIQISPVLARIEAEFGRPVIASNQAVVWHCLRRLGIEDRYPGYGALLEGTFDPA
ncbi:maleate cis-trans isomerase family protein [Pseudodonghicola flavimaris]|uniref:Aspartate/glutamate racemase family protein n=1 Tax=Pseudodonghicola flavimaris TaxID=3050036 RepID=A0ABT7F2C8_9RHOB|nr:aspartate/glutamate racemase family protein [Pseudodonghicola flavimaris]MDK3018758.1 aspartate/glutamate racemase family protein [Pseudodonghicola flavimaris]